MKKIFGFALVMTVLVASLAVTQSVSSQETPPITIIDIAEGTAVDINEAGQVTGYYLTADDGDHAFRWTETGEMTDIGQGIGLNINDLGQVIGISGGHAFLWTETAGRQPIQFFDAPITLAFDINNQGQVVGWYNYSCSGWGCLFPACDGAFLWTEANGMVDLTEETGLPLTCAYDINENGQIVGDSDNGPYVWSQTDGIQYITANPNDRAYSINDAGQVAGSTSEGEIYIWSAGVMTYLNIQDSGYVFINDLGQVTGSVAITEGETWNSYGFFWSLETSRLLLPSLSCPEYTFPNSYGARSNNVGQVVGASCGEAVLWNIELPTPTPQKQIALIDTKVDALVSTGILDQGEGTALISKLDAATFLVNKGNNKAARNILGAFINTVEAFVNSERLTSVQAQPLIDSTNTAINSLP